MRASCRGRSWTSFDDWHPSPGDACDERCGNLGRGRGDIKALEAPLDGYCRLRVGGYRVIFAYGQRGVIECIFAEQRSLVYELLLERLRDRLRTGEE